MIRRLENLGMGHNLSKSLRRVRKLCLMDDPCQVGTYELFLTSVHVCLMLYTHQYTNCVMAKMCPIENNETWYYIWILFIQDSHTDMNSFIFWGIINNKTLLLFHCHQNAMRRRHTVLIASKTLIHPFVSLQWSTKYQRALPWYHDNSAISPRRIERIAV